MHMCVAPAGVTTVQIGGCTTPPARCSAAGLPFCRRSCMLSNGQRVPLLTLPL
jgi:hypothetical protein